MHNLFFKEMDNHRIGYQTGCTLGNLLCNEKVSH
jgi:hypothetical protein